MNNRQNMEWLSQEKWPLNLLDNQLNLLQVVDPKLYHLLQKTRKELSHIHVVFTNGQPQCIRYADSRIHRWQSSLEFQNEFRNRLSAILQKKPNFFILVGSGCGFEFMEIYHALQNYQETTVLVLEKDPISILLAFTFHDLRQVLLQGSLLWAIGEPLSTAVLETLREHALLLRISGPIDILFSTNQLNPAERQSIIQSFQSALQNVSEDAHQFQNAQIKFNSRSSKLPAIPSHVWSSCSLSEYSTDPILRAFHRGFSSEGIQTTLTSLPRGRTRKWVEYRGFVEACPDSLLVLNDPSYGYIPSGNYHRMVWVTDDPAFRKNLQIAPRYSPDEYILYADPTYIPELQRQGAERLIPLSVFALLEHAGTFRKEYAFPIVFVGIIWNIEPFLARLNTNDRDLIEQVYDDVQHTNWGTTVLPQIWSQKPITPTLTKAVLSMLQSMGRYFQEIPLAMSYFTYLLDIYRRRWAMAQSLLPYGLHVFGNPDWLSLLGNEYASRYHGFIPYPELADLYASSNVIVGIHSLQLPTALNIRDYDVLQAGGCLLSDPIAGMSPDTLFPGRDCEIAHSPTEFAEKAHYLLHHEDHRNQLAQQGRQTVLRHHLPQHRIHNLMEQFKTYIS